MVSTYDGEPLVRVHSDTEESRVGVDEPFNVALLQIEQNTGLVEVGQVGHVLATVVLGGVDLPNHVLLELPRLAFVRSHHQLHLHLVPIRLLNHPLNIIYDVIRYRRTRNFMLFLLNIYFL